MPREPYMYRGEDGPLWQAALIWLGFILALGAATAVLSAVWRLVTSS